MKAVFSPPNCTSELQPLELGTITSGSVQEGWKAVSYMAKGPGNEAKYPV
jgi:hypothetical protein